MIWSIICKRNTIFMCDEAHAKVLEEADQESLPCTTTEHKGNNQTFQHFQFLLS